MASISNRQQKDSILCKGFSAPNTGLIDGWLRGHLAATRSPLAQKFFVDRV